MEDEPASDIGRNCRTCGQPLAIDDSNRVCPACLQKDGTSSTILEELDSDDAVGGQTTIGPYRLISRLGTGGFGDVYLAEQTEPVHRQVALKVIKPGMDSREIVTRFEAERQALALMDHPNIAHVYDAGTTARGLPYFVMELVKGIPIARYCDEHRLCVGDRLKLFIQVCAGVQHAHQKGIVHRDLKPANILVTELDGEPVVKVIDFGIAKALHSKLTEQSLLTVDGMMIGTPQYMSPEQVVGNTDHVDTRTDIFALGVILYELLTGQPPIPYAEFEEAGFGEIIRIICEKDAPRASICIKRSGVYAATVAETRNTGVRRLLRQVRGDLECIMQKAVEKERDRRYPSVSLLADDVRRFLDNETVNARPPTWGYRFRKYARRHKGQMAAACAILATLIFGIVASSWFAWQSMQDAERARVAELKERFGREATSALQTAPNSPREALQRLDSVVRGWEARFGSNEAFSTPVISALAQVPDLCRETVRYTFQSEPVTLSVSPDQQSVAIAFAGHNDGTPPPMIYWKNLGNDSPRVVYRIEGTSSKLTDLVMSGNHEAFAGFKEGMIKRISMTTGLTEVEWETNAPVSALAFARDANLLISLDASGNLRRWTRDGSEQGEPVFVGSSFFNHLSVADDGTLAAVSENVGTETGLTIIKWRNEIGMVHHAETPGTRVTSVIVGPDGDQIITGHIDGQIHIRDANGASNGLPIIAHRKPVDELGWVGENIASAAHDGTIRVWNPAGAPMTPELKGHTMVVGLAGILNDHYLFSVGKLDKTARAWNLSGLQIRPEIPISGSAERLVFAGENGRLLIGAMSDGNLTSWDWATGEQSASETAVGEVFNLSVNGNGSLIGCVHRNDGKVHLFQSKTLQVLTEIEVEGERFLASAFHPDSDRLFAFSQSGTLYQCDPNSGWLPEKTGRYPAPSTSDTVLLQWVPEKQALLIAGGKMNPLLVSETGEVIATLKIGDNSHRSVVNWPDQKGNQHFIFGHTSNRPSVDYAVATDRQFTAEPPVKVFPSRTMTEEIVFSPASGVTCIGEIYGKLVMINRDREIISPPIRPHKGNIESLAAHPSLQFIASSGHDAIRFWASGPDAWRELLDRRLAVRLETSPQFASSRPKHSLAYSSSGTHFEAAGLTIPAHPDWQPASKALLNTGYEIIVRSLGDNYRRLKLRGLYRVQSDDTAESSSNLFLGNQLYIGEVPELTRPEYYVPKLRIHLSRVFDAVNRHLGPSVTVDQSKVEMEWLSEPGLIRCTGILAYSSGGKANFAIYIFPVDGTTVGVIAFGKQGDPGAAQFLEQVEAKCLTAVVRPKNRLSPERLAAIETEVNNQAVLFQIGKETLRQYHRLSGQWGQTRGKKDQPSRAKLLELSRQLVTLTDEVLAKTDEDWTGRFGWQRKRNLQSIRLAVARGLSGSMDEAAPVIEREMKWARDRWQQHRTHADCLHLIDVLKDYDRYQFDLGRPIPDRIATKQQIIEFCRIHIEMTNGDQKIIDLINNLHYLGRLHFQHKDPEMGNTSIYEALDLWKQWSAEQPVEKQRPELPREIYSFLSDVERDQKNPDQALTLAHGALQYNRQLLRYNDNRTNRAKHSEILWKVANRERDAVGYPNEAAFNAGRESIKILKELHAVTPLSEGNQRNIASREETLKNWTDQVKGR